MKKTVVTALVAALSLSASAGPARASPSAESRQKVIYLIGGVHGAPHRDVLLEATPAAKEVLIGLARDAQLSPSLRGRAVSTLSAWPEPDVRALFVELLRDPSVVGLMRHRAVLAHARAFQGDALPEITAALKSPDLQLRLTALTALGLLPESKARPQLLAAARPTQPALIREQAERLLLRSPTPPAR